MDPSKIADHLKVNTRYLKNGTWATIMSYNVIFLTLVAFSITSTGCGLAAIPNPAGTELNGTWKTACTNTGPGGTYQIDTWNFSSASVIDTQLNFGTDSTCSIANLTYTLYTTSIYAVGLTDTAATPPTSKYLNITLNTIGATPQNAAGVTAISNLGCTPAITPTSGSATSLLGETCGSKTYTAGIVTYQIYSLVTTTTPNTVAFGVTTVSLDASSPLKTPTTIQTTTYAKP